MNIGQRLLLFFPPFVLGIIIISVSVILSVLGLIIVRHFIPHHRLKLHNDVAGFLFGTLGVIYAVLLAFIVVVVWQNFDEVDSNMELEANYLTDLYTDSISFPDTLKKDLHKNFYEYAKAILNEEWDMLKKGKSSSMAKDVIERIWLLYGTYIPETKTQEIFLEESIDKLNKMCELRRQRLIDSRKGISPLLWFVLIFGGIVTISFTFFFGTENFRAQITMTILLTIIVSLILFTVLELDYPFTGGMNVSLDGFKGIVDALPR